MKKILITFLVAIFISLTFLSCSKCGHCHWGGSIPDSAVLCPNENKMVYDVSKKNCKLTGTWVTE